MGYKIVYEYDTERVNAEAKLKGWRGDVSVVVNDKKYELYITDVGRLLQDNEFSLNNNGYTFNEPNVVIVKEVTKVEIEKTIKKLYTENFFKHLGYS